MSEQTNMDAVAKYVNGLKRLSSLQEHAGVTRSTIWEAKEKGKFDLIDIDGKMFVKSFDLVELDGKLIARQNTRYQSWLRGVTKRKQKATA